MIGGEQQAKSSATSRRNMIIAGAFAVAVLGGVVYVARNPSVIDRAADVASGKSTINAGRFCRKDDARVCWDVDMPGPVVVFVWPSGERAPKGIQTKPGTGDVDFEISAGDDGKTQFKIARPNTLMVKHSGNKEWNEFVRK